MVGILVAPLFRWQTAAVTLLIDQYELGTIEPVPFGTGDRAALADALAGRLGTKLGDAIVDLTGLESAAGLRELLLPRMKRLDVRPKDVMIAYVRSQAIVAPPTGGTDPDSRSDPLVGRACFLAGDLTIAGPRPRELVPIRDIVEAIGAAPPVTTLHVLDLGDLSWEPRLGVLANVVSRTLDSDFATPQVSAKYHNWVLGSHDLFQHSAVSPAGGRTYFARAVELALRGDADEPPWGDGDGVIELHEIVPFVKAWTAEWVHRATGGRSVQTPVLWKLGVGRIATNEIPIDVPLLRVPRGAPKKASSEEGPPAAVRSQESAGQATPPAAAPSGGEPRSVPPAPDAKPAAPPQPADATVRPTAATADASPGTQGTAVNAPQPAAAGGTQPRGGGAETQADQSAAAATAAPPAGQQAAKPDQGDDDKQGDKPGKEPLPEPAAKPEKPRPPADAWEALARFADRRHHLRQGESGVSATRGPGAVVVDFAPHLWAQLYELVASADIRRRAAGPLAERAEVAFAQLGEDLCSLWVAWAEGTGISTVRATTSTGIRLQAALARAEDDAFASRWADAPSTFARALAARNDALVVLRSIIDVSGKFGGGAATPPIDPVRVAALLDNLADVTAMIRRTPRSGQMAATVAGLDPLSAATRSLVAETTIAVEQLQGVIRSHVSKPHASDDVVPHEVVPHESYGFEGWIAALGSPVIGTDLRERIDRRLQDLLDATTSPRAPPDASAPKPAAVSPANRLPETTLPVPMVVEIDDLIDRTNLEFIAGRALEIAGLVEAGVLAGADLAELPDFRGLAADIAALRRAAADLPKTAADRKASLDQIVSLGGLVAQLEARIAGLVGMQRNKEGFSSRTLDDVGAGLLRLLDARDAANLDRPIVAGMPDWMPRVNTGLAFESRGGRRLSLAEPLEGRIVVPGNQPLPSDAVLRMSFDPADIRVVVEGGREVRPLEALPTRDLPFAGGGLGVDIVANRDRTANEKPFVVLSVTLDSTTLSGAADVQLDLPARRDIALGVRRVPREPGMGASWRFASRSSRSIPSSGGPKAERFEVDLRAIPGMTAAWELALENRADIARTFVARLFSLPATEPVNSQSGRTRSAVWSDFCDAVEAGDAAPEPVATIDKLSLGPQSEPTLLAFPPPPPKAELPPPPSAGGAPQPAAAPSISSDFAVVLDETTPGEPKRSFFVRLKLSVEHPRERLRATATWSRDDRVISVRIEPAETAGTEALPPEGLRVALEPLPSAPVREAQPLGMRRAATVLTRSRPRDVLTATWQGSDTDARAWLSVSVNGYPRAFVFIVDCSAAADGIVQEPQDDFRAITFGGPRPVVPEALKAPADAIPITLLVDAPPDVRPPDDAAASAASSRGREPIVTLAFRAVRAGGMMAEGTQTVWTAVGDRRVTYAAQPPKGSAVLAVSAAVADWSIEPTGEGYVDLDLVAEATLAAPGMAASLKDTRTFVMDGRPPKVEVPPLVNATVGRRLTIPVQAVDDPRESFALAPGTHIPGVSGVARVEWALDLKGDGTPEAWAPAIGLGGGGYEVRVDTQQLPPGVRVPLLVRATDRVGLAHPPSRVWIDTAVVAAKGQINGRVVLQNRGERNVLVRIDGPNAPPAQRSGTNGAFTFRDLDPGTYTLKAAGPVRNRSYTSEATTAVVTPPPAPAPNVTLELK